MPLLGKLEPLTVAVVAGYFLVLVVIGYYGYSRTADEEDFLVAGREVGPFVGAATFSASQMSAGTFVGAFGIHYLLGVGFIWAWVGIWTGWLVSLVAVAPQLRRFGEMTVPDFVAARYPNDGAGGDYSRALAALLIVVVYTVFLSAQIKAGSLIFQFLLGIPEVVGMVTMIVIAIVYTAVGGMRASVLTDFFQAVIMGIGAVIAVPVALFYIGGVGAINGLLGSLDPSLVGQSFSTGNLVGFMSAFALSKAAAPRDISRAYTMRDEQTVRRAILIALVFQLFIALSVALLGVTVRVMFPELSTADFAVLVLSMNVLGPLLGGILVVAVFSAILSTIDSVLIVSGAGVAHDIYARIVNPEATERQRLRANRLAVPVLGALPLGLALASGLVGDLVEVIVILQASMMGGTFFIPFVLGLHWRRANTYGGVAGMALGFLTVVLWHLGADVFGVIPASVTGVIGDPVIPGVLVSLVAYVGVSMLTAPPEREALYRFFTQN